MRYIDLNPNRQVKYLFNDGNIDNNTFFFGHSIGCQALVKFIEKNKINNSVEYNKITFILKENNNKQYYQIEKFTDKQVFHENIDKDIFRYYEWRKYSIHSS